MTNTAQLIRRKQGRELGGHGGSQLELAQRPETMCIHSLRVLASVLVGYPLPLRLLSLVLGQVGRGMQRAEPLPVWHALAFNAGGKVVLEQLEAMGNGKYTRGGGHGPRGNGWVWTR